MTKFRFLFPIILLIWANSPGAAQNANVPVTVGDPDDALVQAAPQARSTVRGRVFYESTGRPVRRASLMLMARSGNGREAAGLTDTNGNFQIDNVAAGTYYAFVNAPGVVTPLAYADLSSAIDRGFGEAVENFEPIVVDGVNDIEVQIAAKQGGAISGRISYADGDPAIGVKVEVLRRVEDRYVPVIPNFSSIFSMFGGGGFQTDDRGVYRFSGLPAGEYIVKATESVSHGDGNRRGDMIFGSGLFGGSSLLTLFYPDAFETEKAGIINVFPGQEMSEINLTILDRALYRVEGKVVSGKDKSPAGGAKVMIKKKGDDTYSLFNEMGRVLENSNTDDEGNWSFKDLPPGTYQVIVKPDNMEPDYYGDGAGYPANRPRANRPKAPPIPKLANKTLEITIIDKNISELLIELGHGATISGTVFTENSKEMPDAVDISVSGSDKELDVRTGVMNYSRESAPQPVAIDHDFKLENVSEGKIRFNVRVNDENFYVKSATLNNADILGNPFELKENDDLKNVRIVLAKDVGSIKGKVQDVDKQPRRNRRFVLVPVNPGRRRAAMFYRTVTSDENGEFTVKAAPDEYAVVIFDQRTAENDSEGFYAWLDKAIKDAEKVTVKAGETSTVTLTLP